MGRRTLCFGAYYPIKSLEAYGFDREPSIQRVNTFQEIGWPDPFPSRQVVYVGRYEEPRIYQADLKAYQTNARKHNRKLRARDCIVGSSRVNPDELLA